MLNDHAGHCLLARFVLLNLCSVPLSFVAMPAHRAAKVRFGGFQAGPLLAPNGSADNGFHVCTRLPEGYSFGFLS